MYGSRPAPVASRRRRCRHHYRCRRRDRRQPVGAFPAAPTARSATSAPNSWSGVATGAELTDLGRQAVEQGRSIVARYDQLRQHIVESTGLAPRHGSGRRRGDRHLIPAAAGDRRVPVHPSRHPLLRQGGWKPRDRVRCQRRSSSSSASSPSRWQTATCDITDPWIDEIVLVARADHPFVARRIVARRPRGAALRRLSSRAARSARSSTAPCEPRAWRSRS